MLAADSVMASVCQTRQLAVTVRAQQRSDEEARLMISQLLPGAFAMPRPSVRAPAAVRGSNQCDRGRLFEFERGLTRRFRSDPAVSVVSQSARVHLLQAFCNGLQ